MNLAGTIESVLFWKNEPVAISALAKMVGVEEKAAREAISELGASLAGRGIRLSELNDQVALVTAPETSDLISRLTKEELSHDLGRAGLETLAIVIYQGPVTRADIDYIRGVNSSFILRSLLVRGLVERLPHPSDSRSFIYQPTFDLLAQLGVSRLEELPEYQTIKDKLVATISARPAETTTATPTS